jgi:hypothetical protein
MEHRSEKENQVLEDFKRDFGIRLNETFPSAPKQFDQSQKKGTF